MRTSPRMPDQPTYLLHVGYPKAASTWMQRKVFVTMAEIDVLSVVPEFREALTNLQTHTDSFEEESFRSALAERERLVGLPMMLTRESLIRTPLDANRGDTIENTDRLARLCPGARILIVVRRQHDLLPSLFSQYVHEGGTRSLKAVLADKDPACPMDLEFFDVARVVDHYKLRFGDENVVVVPFELLRSDPERFLDHLDRFLGTPIARESLDLQPINLSTVPILLPVLRVWNRIFRRSRFNEKPPLGWMPGHLMGRKVLQGSASNVARRIGIKGTLKLADDYLDDLRPRLRDYNRDLQKHVSVDLASLGYIV